MPNKVVYRYSPVIPVSADLHGHLYTPHSRIDSNGYNSRLIVCAKALEQVGNYIEEIRTDKGDEWHGVVERGVRHLHIFCGDLIHSRIAVNTVVGNVLRASLGILNKKGLDTLANIGNHDMYLRKDGEVSLSMFEPDLAVKSGGCQYKLKSGEVLYVFFIPFTADQQELRSRIKAAEEKKGDKNILVAHTGLREAVAGVYGYRLKDELPVDVLKELEYDWYFVGHYHIPQDFGDGVLIPGSLVQHTFGEREREHGFFVVNLEDDSYRFVASDSPQFIWEELKRIPDGPKPEWIGNYVKLLFADVDLYNEFQEYVEEYKEAGVLSIVRELKAKGSRFEEKATKDTQVEYGMSLSEMVSSFVKRHVEEKDREAVQEKGLQLLRTVESES